MKIELGAMAVLAITMIGASVLIAQDKPASFKLEAGCASEHVYANPRSRND